MTCLGCLWVTDIRKKSRGVSLADADNAGPEQVSGVMPVGSHRCQRRLQAHGGQVYTQGPGDAPRACFAVCIGLRAWRLPRPSFFCTALLTRCRLTPRAPLQLCRKIIPRVLVALRSDAARGKALPIVMATDLALNLCEHDAQRHPRQIHPSECVLVGSQPAQWR